MPLATMSERPHSKTSTLQMHLYNWSSFKIVFSPDWFYSTWDSLYFSFPATQPMYSVTLLHTTIFRYSYFFPHAKKHSVPAIKAINGWKHLAKADRAAIILGVLQMVGIVSWCSLEVWYFFCQEHLITQTHTLYLKGCTIHPVINRTFHSLSVEWVK